MRSTFSTVWFLYKSYEGGVVIISMLANVWAVGTSAVYNRYIYIRHFEICFSNLTMVAVYDCCNWFSLIVM